MIKHEEKYIIYECVRVCLYVEEQFKLDPAFSSIFFILGLRLCLYDYCNDFDWFGQSAKHWKSSYMRELIIVIVEPFLLLLFNVCSFYPFDCASNEMLFFLLWNRKKGFVSTFGPKIWPLQWIQISKMNKN